MFDSLHPSAKHATEVITKAGEALKSDRTRPIYHILPPSRWLNDPNGPIYYRGWYHLFYQLDPYDPLGFVKYWGHVRSKDLVKWEHMPVALWPSVEHGEDGIWSGCATIDGRGRAVALYTSVRSDPGPSTHAEQWLAIAEDDDLVVWRKHPDNPIIDESIHGDTKIFNWRDPFIFHHEGEVYCVLGGHLSKESGLAIIPLYRAKNGDLTEWEYLGSMWNNPDPSVANHECPNFFPLDGPNGKRWVLIVSPYGTCYWYAGEFDPSVPEFRPDSTGILGHGRPYAPNTLFAPNDRLIQFDWIIDRQENREWNGCITIPRELSIDASGGLRQEPLTELDALRAEHIRIDEKPLGADPVRIDLPDDAVEMDITLSVGGANTVRLAVQQADGTEVFAIEWRDEALCVPGVDPVPLPPADNKVRLRVYLDRTVIEIFAHNGERWATNLRAPGEHPVLSATAEGTASIAALDVWRMESIW